MPSLLESGREMCSGHLISRRRLCLRWDIVVLRPRTGLLSMRVEVCSGYFA